MRSRFLVIDFKIVVEKWMYEPLANVFLITSVNSNTNLQMNILSNGFFEISSQLNSDHFFYYTKKYLPNTEYQFHLIQDKFSNGKIRFRILVNGYLEMETSTYNQGSYPNTDFWLSDPDHESAGDYVKLSEFKISNYP